MTRFSQIVLILSLSLLTMAPMIASANPFSTTSGLSPTMGMGTGSFLGGVGHSMMRGMEASSQLNCMMRGICPHPVTNTATGTVTDPRKGLAMARRIMKDVMDEMPAEPGEHYTRPYTRRNGSYVSGHYATNPDSSQLNNWSTRGNINPHTGREGDTSPHLQHISAAVEPASQHSRTQNNRHHIATSEPSLPPPLPLPPEEMEH